MSVSTGHRLLLNPLSAAVLQVPGCQAEGSAAAEFLAKPGAMTPRLNGGVARDAKQRRVTHCLRSACGVGTWATFWLCLAGLGERLDVELLCM